MVNLVQVIRSSIDLKGIKSYGRYEYLRTKGLGSLPGHRILRLHS